MLAAKMDTSQSLKVTASRDAAPPMPGTVLIGYYRYPRHRAPRVFHHELALELELMVHVGLTPEQALRTATVNRAELMGWTDTLGTLAPEKEADIVLLEGRPLDDISATKHVRRVFKGGKQALHA